MQSKSFVVHDRKRKTPFLIRLFRRLAPKVGVKLLVEPEWGCAARLVYKNGVTHFLRGFALDLNSLGSSKIAKDKSYAKFFIERVGYSVAPDRTFFQMIGHGPSGVPAL